MSTYPGPGQLAVIPGPVYPPLTPAQLATARAMIADPPPAQVVPMGVIGGEHVPLDQCTWVAYAPCGCATGVALADYTPVEADVWLGFTYHHTAREVARDKAAGFRVVLHRRTEANATVLSTLGDPCPHTPRLGIPPTPELPVGRVWAVRDYWRAPGMLIKHAVELGPAHTHAYARSYHRPGKAWCGSTFGHHGGAVPDWYFDDGLAPDRDAGRPDIARVLHEALECAACLTKLTRWDATVRPALPLESP